MKDPYQVLGVARTSSDEDIKKAYRKLARELHPDLNPGDHKAEERFKEISAAYDFLSDAAKRAQFDAGEIDASGAQKRRAWRGHGPGAGAGARRGGGPFGDNVDDILSELLRRKERGKAQAKSGAAGGFGGDGDLRVSLSVGFTDACAGTMRRVTLDRGRVVEVRIPPGTVDGQTLRLKGQGRVGFIGVEPGDAYVDIKVEPHPHFTRRDRDILIEIPISVQEAILGGKITVPTIDGKVTVTVPPESNTGSVLRLKGRGIAAADGSRGDQLVTLTVVLPEHDAEFRKLVEKWGPRHGYDPRAKSGL
ncbi:molecular chaperone DnaJ [Paramagnetospirillum marisnigri]|uniref:Molecular chaperone DnaJ n=1 Tax=Paramagnetospirillum marisnigri TaxID=1285242 RepID=A0A178MDD6_9PROT|nr:J domain-containing protein [Paramagnetospirillum marisnigri]OAN46779.1 molecular chaperone DnaJ [Paramagnetospirillum marisnigri]